MDVFCVFLLRLFILQTRNGVILLENNWKPDQKIIGENIKEARKNAHMTQEQLAEEIGGTCTNKVISRYEKGNVEMGVQALIDVAEALEVPVDNLMPDRVRVHNEPEKSQQSELSRIFAGLNSHHQAMLVEMARMMENEEKMKIAM